MTDTQNNNQEEPTVIIGQVSIPEWQFDIYYKEAEKFLNDLNTETEKSKNNGVSKQLVRAVHTLSGISNTLGIDSIAKVGYILEEWLNINLDTKPDQALSESDFNLLKSASASLNIMVQNTRNKEEITIDNKELINNLNAWVSSKSSANSDNSNTEMSDDWFEKEMASIENSMSESLDSDGSDWLIDLDDVSSASDSGFSLDSIMQELEAANKHIEPAKPHSTSSVEFVDIKAQSAPVSKFDVPVAHSELKEIRDFRSYLPELLPTNDVSDDISDESIKEIFLEEATEIFDNLPSDIDAWSLSKGMDVDKSNKIKRALHTLKGSSRMAGFLRFGTVVHNIETVVELGHSSLSTEYIPDLVQAVCDALAQELEHIKTPILVKSGLASMKEGESVQPAEVSIKHVEHELDKDLIQTELPKTSIYAEQRIKDMVPEQAPVNESAEANVASILKVPTEKVDTLANHLGKAGMISLRVENAVDRISSNISEMTINMDRLRRLLKDVEIQAETQMKSRMADAQKDSSTFDPLEFDRFTKLQELTRMTAEALNDINNSQGEIVKGLTDIQDSVAENIIISEDMQHAVMSVRTVPVQSLGRRLERTVRTSCGYTQKNAALYLDSDIEVDSGVLNKVIAPLDHLLRNSITHGIESSEKRAELGKPLKGTITLQVRQRGNDVVFKLSDDGAGISKEAVQKKAREKGLISADAIITQEKANQLIFEPGFSTATEVSDLAGRGVGMDVVISEIAGMGGRVHVFSEPGKGTIFELVVPAYMAVISMVPIKARNVSYAVPSSLVRDVVVVRDTVLLDAYETGVLIYNNESYPFYNLAEAAGLPASEILRNNRILLADDTTGVAAVHIDSLESDRNLVMKPLCRAVASLPGLLGASVAGDGTPLLVLNPVELKASVQKIGHSHTTSNSLKGKSRTKSDITVMVVDDSLTVRRITQKFLDREGFKCVLAKDGLDAIEKIQEFGKPDIFLLDIEMPNMDGFQLTEHIRTSVSKEIPIVMISSRSIDKYAAHAKALGVNRSLGKPYQEPELLAAILEFTGLTV